MKILKTLKVSVAAAAMAAGMAFGSPALAQGVPVVDAKSILQDIKQLEQMAKDFGLQTEQLQAMLDQIQTLQDQLARLEEMERLISDPTEIIGLVMGDDLNGLLEGNFDLDIDMVGTIVAGAQGDWSGIIGSDAAGLISKIENTFTNAGTSQEEITAMSASDNLVERNNATAAAGSAATSAAAEVAYEQAQVSRTRVVQLVDEIGNLDGLKESVDHNTRVTAELAIAMAALWQLESVQTINAGMGGVLDASTVAEIQKYNDFTLPGSE